MVAPWPLWLERWRPRRYGRRPTLVLVNGLAEQAESWYCNHRFWRRYFDVHLPEVIAYDGEALHRRIDAGLPVDVDFFVGRLHQYLADFAPRPPYHLVASSLGGKITVEFAFRYPELVGRIVLLCPSGLGDSERLPIVEGVRRQDLNSLVASVFHDPRHVDPGIVLYYRRQFADRRWRTGLFRTVRGTAAHCVRPKLARVSHPTLLVTGAQDRIVDSATAEAAARELPRGQFFKVPNCGHAPQIEKAWLVNRLVFRFLTDPLPTSHPPLVRLLTA
jgi:pimeloyl-ACP methyl ester carboxylesterase